MSDVLPKYARTAVRLLVRRQDREAYLGDLTQKYTFRMKRDGVRKADAWLRRELLESVGPLLALRAVLLVKFGKMLKRMIEYLWFE